MAVADSLKCSSFAHAIRTFVKNEKYAAKVVCENSVTVLCSMAISLRLTALITPGLRYPSFQPFSEPLYFRFNRWAGSCRAPVRKISLRRSSENDPGWRNTTTAYSFMAYSFLREMGVFINAGMRRLQAPSASFRFNSENYLFCFGRRYFSRQILKRFDVSERPSWKFHEELVVVAQLCFPQFERLCIGSNFIEFNWLVSPL